MTKIEIGKDKVALIDIKLNARFDAIPILVNHQQIALVPTDIDVEFDEEEIETYVKIIVKALKQYHSANGQ